jgi:hypothetical protein
MLAKVWPRRWRPRIVEHQPAKELADQFGLFWRSALKVTSVRNPWDILVSAWQWRRDGRGGRAQPIDTDFQDWAAAAMSEDAQWQRRCHAYDAKNLMHPFMFIDGKLSVDYLIRQEAINEGLDWLAHRLGVSLEPMTVREKPSQRTRDYRAYYTDALAERVAQYFSDIIEVTGYRFA